MRLETKYVVDTKRYCCTAALPMSLIIGGQFIEIMTVIGTLMQSPATGI